MEEKVLYEEHPCMFRNNPIGFVLAIVLCLVLIGFVILLIWRLRTLGTTLTVTNERITLRRGILSKHTNDIYHSDVRNVQIAQTFFQRIFDVGTVGIASAGSGAMEITVVGMPQPNKVKELINQHRRSA